MEEAPGCLLDLKIRHHRQSERMCKNGMDVSICANVFRLPYRVIVGVAGAEMEGEEEGRLEIRLHQGPWAGELG